MDFKFMVEPIIIMTKKLDTWTHPFIQQICDEQKDTDQINASSGVWSGPWIRIYFKQGTETVYTVCRFDSNEGYQEHINKFYKKFNDNYDEADADLIGQQIIGSFVVAIGEDVWSPDGTQFLYSDYGSKLNELVDVFADDFEVFFISPDVSIHDMGDGSWSS
jgi:hypothetical protein